MVLAALGRRLDHLRRRRLRPGDRQQPDATGALAGRRPRRPDRQRGHAASRRAANTRVQALAVNGNTLYIGGVLHDAAAGSRGARLAAVNATTGALLDWHRRPIVTSSSMTVHRPGPRRSSAARSPPQRHGAAGMTSFDGVTGAMTPWAINGHPELRPEHGDHRPDHRRRRPSSARRATTRRRGTTANFEGILGRSRLTGELDWINGCRGDNYADRRDRQRPLQRQPHARVRDGRVQAGDETPPVAVAMAIDKRGPRARPTSYGPLRGNWLRRRPPANQMLSLAAARSSTGPTRGATRPAGASSRTASTSSTAASSRG